MIQTRLQMSSFVHAYIIDVEAVARSLGASDSWHTAMKRCGQLGDHRHPEHLASFQLAFLDRVPEVKRLVFGAAPSALVANLGMPRNEVISWVPRAELASAIATFDLGGSDCGCPSDALLASMRQLVESGQRLAAARLAEAELGMTTAGAWKYVGSAPWRSHTAHASLRVPPRSGPPDPDIAPAITEMRSWLVAAQERDLDLILMLS